MRSLRSQICHCQASHPEPQTIGWRPTVRYSTSFLSSRSVGSSSVWRLTFSPRCLLCLFCFLFSVFSKVLMSSRFLLASISLKRVADIEHYSKHRNKPSQHAVMMCIVVSMEMWGVSCSLLQPTSSPFHLHWLSSWSLGRLWMLTTCLMMTQ